MLLRWLVAGVVAVAAVGVTGLAFRHEAAHDDGDLTVVTFNLCSNACRPGTGTSARFVARLAERVDADVVLLQETCRAESELVARRLHGTAFHVTTFDGQIADLNRCEGLDYGTAVVVRGQARGFGVPLPNPSSDTTSFEVRGMACADTGAFVACSAHLVPPTFDAPTSAAQVAAVGTAARRLADEHPTVIVGGDLNVPVGALGSGGDFVGDASRGVDHVLATRRRFHPPRVQRERCTCSDHQALIARFPSA